MNRQNRLIWHLVNDIFVFYLEIELQNVFTGVLAMFYAYL